MRITYSLLPGDEAQARHFVASVLAAFAACLPVPITHDLEAAIAGRPLTVRFVVARGRATIDPRGSHSGVCLAVATFRGDAEACEPRPSPSC